MRTIRAAAVQLEAHSVFDCDIALKEAIEATREAFGRGADLVALPECTYPAYDLGPWLLEGSSPEPEPTDAVLSKFAGLAHEYAGWVAVGLVETEGERHFNTAYLLAPDGSIRQKARKQFLWDFDNLWFEPGSGCAVTDTGNGRLGLFICADGRLPEIPRLLAVAGADLMIDVTNWVTAGRDKTALTNPQAEYMIRARARENGAYILAANKVGLENSSVLYCGLSQIVSPTGEVLVKASSDRAEIISAEIDPLAAGRHRREALALRVPEVYGAILSTPEPQTPTDLAEIRMAVAQVAWPQEADARRSLAEKFCRIAARQRVELMLFTPLGGTMDEGLGQCSSLCPECTVVFASQGTDESPAEAALFENGREVWRQRAIHHAKGSGSMEVLTTPAARCGIIFAAEGTIPEAARVLTLKGAEVILWAGASAACAPDVFARTRAAENRVTLLCSDAPGEGGGFSMIVDPVGRYLARALPNVDQLITAAVSPAWSANKDVAPGTNTVLGRRPADYAPLVARA